LSIDDPYLAAIAADDTDARDADAVVDAVLLYRGRSAVLSNGSPPIASVFEIPPDGSPASAEIQSSERSQSMSLLPRQSLPCKALFVRGGRLHL
jgi:hypothetical protein